MDSYQVPFLLHYTALQIACVLFFCTLLFYYLGYRTRLRNIRRHKLNEDKSMGALEGSLLGLLALLLSFTFSMSSSRHDKRIQIIVDEANAIGTAMLRADLYPDSVRQAFRHDFREWIDERVRFFEAAHHFDQILASLHRLEKIQQSLWERASYYGQDRDHMHRTSQMVPALNAMFDIVTVRNASLIDHVPSVILFLLFIICLTCSFMVGYSGSSKPDWVIVLSFSVMVATTIYLIIDLDRPRRGVITMKDANLFISELKKAIPDAK